MVERMCKDCIHDGICYLVEHFGRDLESDESCGYFQTKNMVELIRGDWELCQGDVYRCSVCHRATIDDKNGCWALTRYCHNCGATMFWQGGSDG